MVTQEKRANKVKATRMVGQMLDAYYEELKHAPEEGKLVAWVTGPPGFLPLLAMGIPYLHGEAYGATTSARKAEREYKEAAEADGFSPESCSYSRITMGCGLFALHGPPENLAHPEVLMPRPNFIFTLNPGCSTETNWFNTLCRLFDIPGYLIDVPFVWREEDLDRHSAHVAEQFRGFVAFLEKLSGRPFDWARLQEGVATLKQAATLRQEAMKLCRHKPSPASFFDWAISLGPVNFLAGWPGTVEYFQSMKAELEERIAQGVGAVPQERSRLLFDGIILWPKIGALADKFASLDACAIAGRYTHLGFYNEPERIDPEKPLESIADFVVRSVLNRTPQWQARAAVQLCREYALDGVAVHALHTCRPFDIAQHDIVETISRELGLPVSTFEGDHGDVNYYSDAQVNTRVQALVETIQASKRG